jgi:hypothetical protein
MGAMRAGGAGAAGRRGGLGDVRLRRAPAGQADDEPLGSLVALFGERQG